MTTKADFTDEEWTRLERAPFVAGYGDLAGGPGRTDRSREGIDGHAQDRFRGGAAGGRGELADAVSNSGRREAQAAPKSAQRFKPPKGALAGEAILDELRAVNAAVTKKATPEEAAGYRELLL
jgi:hypothetical protein